MVRWAEFHENKPWLLHLTLKNCVVARTICLVGASGTTHMLKCDLLIWGPNARVIASLTSFLYIHMCMCIYICMCVYICIYAH